VSRRFERRDRAKRAPRGITPHARALFDPDAGLRPTVWHRSPTAGGRALPTVDAGSTDMPTISTPTLSLTDIGAGRPGR